MAERTGFRRFEGKVALVTGAGSGLGRATAVHLAGEGATVAVHYNASEAGALETLRLVEEAGGQGMTVSADARQQQSVQEAVTAALARFGRIHVLVNNAGKHRLARSLDQTQDDWEDMIGRNLSGTFFFSQAVGRHMREAGGGHIVNVSSKMATSTAPSNAAYCATKAGVIAMTQVLAAEWARFKIRVNCVAPGVMATGAAGQMTADLDDGGLLQRALEARTPVGRLGNPDEVAAAIAFLASGETDFLTGSTLYVDGGWTSYGDYTGWGFARSLLKQQPA
ncbi:glucose 1-dehydrogenase [Enterovirga sp.]|uniref:SDR family NAD(P)-dependent oxidoreductase n=1 Tax=Enterovirga sp. TaxID=2026350 RepID=UPI0026200481|nr:glucose 1-dehydrogenase [Enterovirga sp.]